MSIRGLIGNSILSNNQYVSAIIFAYPRDKGTNHHQQLNGRAIPYSQGKGLGGSSIRNQMIYQRGSRGSYDYWASEVDDRSYSWENMRKYFDRSVQIHPYNNSFRAANASADYRVAADSMTGGPLKVSWPNFAMPFSSWGLKALFSSGMPRLAGFFSDGDLHGAAYNVCSALMFELCVSYEAGN